MFYNNTLKLLLLGVGIEQKIIIEHTPELCPISYNYSLYYLFYLVVFLIKLILIAIFIESIITKIKIENNFFQKKSSKRRLHFTSF